MKFSNVLIATLAAAFVAAEAVNNPNQVSPQLQSSLTSAYSEWVHSEYEINNQIQEKILSNDSHALSSAASAMSLALDGSNHALWQISQICFTEGSVAHNKQLPIYGSLFPQGGESGTLNIVTPYVTSQMQHLLFAATEKLNMFSNAINYHKDDNLLNNIGSLVHSAEKLNTNTQEFKQLKLVRENLAEAIKNLKQLALSTPRLGHNTLY